MTPEMFENQMKELKEKNVPVIGMQDFLAWKRGEKNDSTEGRNRHASTTAGNPNMKSAGRS